MNVEMSTPYSLLRNSITKKTSIDKVVQNIYDEISKRATTIDTIAYSILTDPSEEVLFIGGDGTIDVYRLSNYEKLFTLKGHQQEVIALAIKSDNSCLFSGGRDKTIRKWDMTNRNNKVLEGHEDAISALVLVDDNKLISSSIDKTMRVWDLINMKLEAKLEEEEEIFSISYTKVGGLIAAACEDSSIRIWSLGKLQRLSILTGHRDKIISLAFLPDERYLISGGWDNTVRIWDVSELRCVDVLEGHNDKVYCVATTHDAKYFFSSGRDKTIKIWDGQSRNVVCTLDELGESTTTMFVSQKNTYLICGADSRVWIWRLSEQYIDFELSAHTGKVTCLLTIPSSPQKLISAGNDRSLCLWGIEDLSLLKQGRGHNGSIWTLAYSKELNAVASGSEDCSVRIWKMDELNSEMALIGHTDAIFCLAFYNKGKNLISGSKDCSLRTWDLEKAAELRKQLCEDIVICAALSHDESILAVGCGSNVEIRKFPSLQLKVSLKKHDLPVTTILMVQDTHVISGSVDGKIIIWSLELEMFETIMQSHTAEITCLTKTHNDRFLISSSKDGFIRFWDITWRKEIACVPLGSPVSSVTLCAGFLFAGMNKSVLAMKNPLSKQSKIKLFGPVPYSLPLTRYIKEFIDDSTHPPQFREEMNNWTVMPWRINMIHLYCYYGNAKYVKQGLSTGCSFIKNKLEETPLYMSMKRGNQNCVEAIAKHVATELEFYPGVLNILEDELPLLNLAAPKSLPIFYQKIFQQPKQVLPPFGIPKGKVPLYHLSKAPLIDPKHFIKHSKPGGKDTFDETHNEKRVIFRITAFRMNFEMGSNQGMQFVRSLTKCKNADVFGTPFVQGYLKYKWNIVKIFLQCQAVLYATLMLLLSLHVIYKDEYPGIMGGILAINTIFTIYEAFQMTIGPLLYLKSYTNILDMLKVTFIYIYSIIYFADSSSPLFLGIVVGLVWTRGFTYFRAFDPTRYLIRMIQEIILDIVPFMIILVFSTLGFSFLFITFSEDMTFVEAFLQVYRLDYGDFETESYTSAQWLCFLIASVLNPLIMLNLLIAIMGDTYDRVQNSFLVANMHEIADVILEFESLLFWKRNKTKKMYFQGCTVFEKEYVQDSWQGKVRELKLQIQKLETLTSRNETKIDSFSDNVKTQLSKIREDNKIKFESIEGKLELLLAKMRINRN